MIGIIDYGSGNIHAIATIYKNLNIKYLIICKPEELDKVDKLILHSLLQSYLSIFKHEKMSI